MRDVRDQIGRRRVTPMLRQFIDAKAACPQESILLFRMGDFYELFFDDARTAARELQLTLTSRDKDSDDPIPMAGVPHHAIAGYITRLVGRGFTVAVCDQVEDPKKAKGIVKRAITRLVTPGTISDLEALDPGAANYLGCISPLDASTEGPRLCLALFDLLAGEILCTRCAADTLDDELQRMGVRELLVAAEHRQLITAAIAAGGGQRVTVREVEINAKGAAASLEARFGSAEVAGRSASDPATPVELATLVALIEFAESTQRRRLCHLMPPRAYQLSDSLVIDEATRRNLEIFTTLDGKKHGSLLWHLDRARTAVGSRALAQWLAFPLRDRSAIEARLDMVGCLRDARELRGRLQEFLDGVRDIERLVGRVAVGRATPKDLVALRASLAAVPQIQHSLGADDSPLGRQWQAADAVADGHALLASALVDEPPVGTSDGGIFARGYRDDLDELIADSSDGHGFLEDLQERERRRTKIPKLKVRYNKVFGYYIEVSRANVDHVPDDYVRKQTLVNAERFITAELKDYEMRVLGADERRKAREQELFVELITEVADYAPRLRALSRLIALTDAILSLAQVADEGRYTRPVLCDDPVLQLRQSRHAVVERLMPGGERFVPNDVDLDADDRQLLIVTGPNMSGKSTVMRQVALCALMAHIGSFVPAKAARIGLCDRIFTRVGASDALSRGHSTFMVEMIETAAILRYATRASLVLLDEIGRGTSTFDGVSIAWSVAEEIHDRIGCRALFATHYHELSDLAVERPRIINVCVAVKEDAGRIVFLRRLQDGAADRSYGIEVARLAGLPDSVLARSREILQNLERGELDEAGLPVLASSRRREGGRRSQLGLFDSPPDPETSSALRAEIDRLDPLNMTPIEALAALDQLKKLSTNS